MWLRNRCEYRTRIKARLTGRGGLAINDFMEARLMGLSDYSRAGTSVRARGLLLGLYILILEITADEHG